MYISDFDVGVQEIRSGFAQSWGQTFDVYRLTAATPPGGILSDQSLIASGVDGFFERITSRKELEFESVVHALAFRGLVDTTSMEFIEGDVFCQRADSYHPEETIFTLAARRPAPRQWVFMATPIRSTITRPESNPQHITSGRVPQSVPVKAREWPLTLDPTLFPEPFSFEETGDNVTVPIGMVMRPLRDLPGTDSQNARLWDDTRRQTWDAFVPQLPGETLVPRDIITGANGDRFEITATQPLTTSFRGILATLTRDRS